MDKCKNVLSGNGIEVESNKICFVVMISMGESNTVVSAVGTYNSIALTHRYVHKQYDTQTQTVF